MTYRASELVTRPFECLAVRGDVLHFVTTRRGGVSGPPYSSANLAFHVGDRPSSVLVNRLRLCSALGLQLGSLTLCAQCHSDRAVVVAAADRGRGAALDSTAIRGADAMATVAPETCLVVLVADCVPVLLFDPVRRAIGTAHAGWRGTVGGIAPHAVQLMESAFGCQPADIVAALGPAISAADYVVGPDVADAYGRAWPEHAFFALRRWTDGAMHLDLQAANRLQLEGAGLPATSVAVCDLGTAGASETYFSARAAGGPTGRFAAGIMLRRP